ncbi:MAG TPA: trypsin-like peptidase domain-containing protein [Candidatus Polarisedimenticolia bacterium]|nr:trypsin-like peptidase domain-containing protein [Candidatus Polarisedimenticolia bacterium]
MPYPSLRAAPRRLSLLTLPFIILMGTVSCAVRAPESSSDHQERIFNARDRVLPALVHIQPVLEVFRAGEKGKMAVTGSGVIFSPEGYILTNTHVVGRAQRLTCVLYNQEEIEARLIGVDPLSDLAVIKIDMATAGPRARHAALGDSSGLQVGQVVMALGSPLGLARSLTLGVISSLDRYFPESILPSGALTGTYNTWIQTDAAINPGNSGGPLVNLDGEVVGINARAVPVFGENLGFSIPINLAKEIAAELIARGQIARSWIGVSWQQIRGLGGHLGVSEETGAVVGNVVPGSPAAEAGLQAGDVVTGIAGEPVAARFEEDLPRLHKRIADLPIGRDVSVVFLRDGESRSATLMTRNRPDVESPELECRDWGFTVQEISEDVAQALRLAHRRGVIVSGVKPNSFADEAGLRRNDIIAIVEGRPIEGLDDYGRYYNEMIEARRGRVLLQVRRGQLETFHVLKPIYDPAGRPGDSGPAGRPGTGGGS